MNGDFADILRNLDMLISQKAKIDLTQAKIWQWRVMNEFPVELKALVAAWASDQPLPEIEYNGVSYDRISNGTGLDFLGADETSEGGVNDAYS